MISPPPVIQGVPLSFSRPVHVFSGFPAPPPPLPARADLERERREECPRKYQNEDGKSGSMTDGCKARGWPLSQSPCPFPLKGDQTWITMNRSPLPFSQPLPRGAYRTASKGWLYFASLESCTVFTSLACDVLGTVSGSRKFLPSRCT